LKEKFTLEAVCEGLIQGVEANIMNENNRKKIAAELEEVGGPILGIRGTGMASLALKNKLKQLRLEKANRETVEAAQFAALQKASNIPFHKMLFFDDLPENILAAQAQGTTAVLVGVTRGLNVEAMDAGIDLWRSKQY
jgi:hypothetical protein